MRLYLWECVWAQSAAYIYILSYFLIFNFKSHYFQRYVIVSYPSSNCTEFFLLLLLLLFSVVKLNLSHIKDQSWHLMQSILNFDEKLYLSSVDCIRNPNDSQLKNHNIRSTLSLYFIYDIWVAVIASESGCDLWFLFLHFFLSTFLSF